MKLGKWAILERPRCHLKREAIGRNYRNDWCENEGDCSKCPTASCYISEGFNIKTEGPIADRTLEITA